MDNLLRRVLSRASLAVLRTDLQASVAIFAFTLFSSVAALSNLLQACCLTDASSVHSGVHQAGSVGRERSFRDGMNRCIPFCIVLVMLVHDCSGLSVMAEDQSKSRKNARRRPQSAWLYLHTTRLVLGSLYGQMGRSASMTAWSEAPRGDCLISLQKSSRYCVKARTNKSNLLARKTTDLANNKKKNSCAKA